jgi:hypothetical protein
MSFHQPLAAANSHRAIQLTDYGNSDIMLAASAPTPVAVAELWTLANECV